MRKAAAGSVVFAWLAMASPSAAIEADPVELAAQGSKPDVAVDADGNAHFVWNRARTGSSDVTHYCKVLPGQTSCKVHRRFAPRGGDPDGSDDLDGPRILVGGGGVIVLSRRCCGGFGPSPTDGVVAFRSRDGGETFASQIVGNQNIAGDAIRGPSGGISTISNGESGGTFYQRHRPGTFAGQSSNLGDADAAQSNSGSLALIDSATPIATFDDTQTTFWRRYSGAGPYNDVASWTPTAAVGPGSEGRLAYGPSGVWLLYRVGAPGSARLVAREFAGNGFDSDEVVVSETGDPVSVDYFQDPAGRLHAVWVAEGGNLMYRRSEDGESYGRTTTLVTPSSGITDLEVAAGEDGNGWVVWEQGSDVRAAALHVDPDPPTLGKDVTVTVVKGDVLVKLPKGKAARVSQKGSDFVPVSVVRSIPVGSIVDTTEGTIRLSSRRKKGGKKQSGTFSKGVFQVLQSRKAKAKGLTELRLKGSIAKHCPKGKKSGVRATASLSKKTIRRLRSKARGRYRTRGRHSAATVRGTTWTVADRCDGTLTKVKRGKVTVRDFRAKRTITLGRGKRYLARARG
jgi:hypothetical protein